MSNTSIKGITKTKGGRYYARFTSKLTGKRVGKRFDNLSDAKLWLDENMYHDRHGDIAYFTDMTVDAWYKKWISILEDTLKPKTVFNYSNYYNNNIKPVIGDMPITHIKPMHCMMVMQQMSGNYEVSSIKQTRVAMSCMFQYAVDNDIILKNPVSKSVIIPSDFSDKDKDERHLLVSDEELACFFDIAKDTNYYLPCKLVLETGLRAGELIGLTWDEIDFEDECIHIRHTLQYDKSKGWYFITPKSKQGTRDIYMTNECKRILEMAHNRSKDRKAKKKCFSQLVFLSIHGMPIRTNTYDIAIANICRKAEIPAFSLHSLRHTFASKCVESGVSPKVLQMIMGHSDISTTMNIYVHITDETKRAEMDKLNVINKA